MVEVDAATPLVGANGRVTLLDAFEGRQQLIAYFHMWFTGEPAEEQCEGCTFCNGQVRELAYLNARGITYATFCWGPYEESVRYRDFMGWDVPWYSVGDSADVLRAGRTLNRFMLVCYLRRGDKVYETYWTFRAGRRRHGADLGIIRLHRLRAAGGLGELARRLAKTRGSREFLAHERTPHSAMASPRCGTFRRADAAQALTDFCYAR